MRVMRFILLTTSAIITPTLAAADPVSAFIAGFTGSGIAGVAGAAAGAIGGLTAVGYAVGAFLGQTILGSLLLNVGVAYLLRPDQPEPPRIEQAQINTRIAQAERYQLGGRVKIGGAAGAFPPMIGWAAATGSVSVEAGLMFCLTFMWTPPHFWALALFMRSDYDDAGVPMLTVTHGRRATRVHILVYTVLLAGLALAAAFA